MSATIVVSTASCVVCNKPSRIEVPTAAWSLWKHGGALIQDAFPDMPEAERETLKSGIHGPCWDAMFGGMEDD